MNILIVGGLLVLAVVAIVGAVLLSIGEERAEKQQKEESAALSVQVSPAPQASDATFPSTMSETLPSGDLRTTRPLAPPLHEDERFSAPRSGQLSVSNEEEDSTFLDGQIDAITDELRSLAQKASELEQRLSALSEILESQLHSQNGATAKTPAFRKIEISSF